MTISDNYKTIFFQFLNEDISVLEIEKYIYKHPELEDYLGKNLYFELINFNFKNKLSSDIFRKIVLENLIGEGQFETWKLKNLLLKFISEPQNAHVYLTNFYDLYCGVYQGNAPRKYEYKFLVNLGLNYLYWIDEGYMKANYGENWESKYEESLMNIEYYHAQLKPFAEEVLEAINSKKIVVLDDGKYSISDEAKTQLISKKVYSLIHP